MTQLTEYRTGRPPALATLLVLQVLRENEGELDLKEWLGVESNGVVVKQGNITSARHMYIREQYELLLGELKEARRDTQQERNQRFKDKSEFLRQIDSLRGQLKGSHKRPENGSQKPKTVRRVLVAGPFLRQFKRLIESLPEEIKAVHTFVWVDKDKPKVTRADVCIGWTKFMNHLTQDKLRKVAVDGQVRLINILQKSEFIAALYKD